MHSSETLHSTTIQTLPTISHTHQCASSQSLQEIEEFSAVSQVGEHVFDGRLPHLKHMTLKEH